MLEDITPNKTGNEQIMKLQTGISHRRGRTCLTHNLNKIPSYLVKARKQSIQIAGAHLFNSLPKSVRNITEASIDAFKSKLDIYLRSNEDLTSLSRAQINWSQRTAATVSNYLAPNLHRGVEQLTFPLKI